jgi:hypothetical protein
MDKCIIFLIFRLLYATSSNVSLIHGACITAFSPEFQQKGGVSPLTFQEVLVKNFAGI